MSHKHVSIDMRGEERQQLYDDTTDDKVAHPAYMTGGKRGFRLGGRYRRLV